MFGGRYDGLCCHRLRNEGRPCCEAVWVVLHIVVYVVVIVVDEVAPMLVVE